MTTTTEPRAGWRPPTLASTRLAVRRWFAFAKRAPSVRAAWRMSGIDARRIPAGSPMLATAWWWSQRTDRLVLFGLVVVLLLAAGGLLWCGQRPSRRLGLAVVLVLLVTVTVLAGG